MRGLVPHQSALAVARMRGVEPEQLSLGDALVALTIDPHEAGDIEMIADRVTLQELDEHYGMRDVALEVAALYIVQHPSLGFVLLDLHDASRWVSRWVLSEAVVCAAEQGGRAGDERITDRVELMRDMATRRVELTRQERHGIAMWDRTSRMAYSSIAKALRAAAQDEPMIIGELAGTPGSTMRARMAYACRAFPAKI